MIFENKRFIGKVKLIRLILMLALTVVVVIISQIKAIDNYAFGLTRWIYVAAVALIYIAISLIRYLKMYSYIYYSDEKGQLEIRYYHSVLLGRKYNVVRIPFQKLEKYELKESALRKNLVLYQREPGGKVAKYPPVPVSAIEPKDLEFILSNIDSYIHPGKS